VLGPGAGSLGGGPAGLVRGGGRISRWAFFVGGAWSADAGWMARGGPVGAGCEVCGDNLAMFVVGDGCEGGARNAMRAGGGA
jgi:hypothetical protein